MAKTESKKAKKAGCTTAGPPEREGAPPTGIRRSRSTRWRIGVLLLVHAVLAAHIAHWARTGSALSPLEPSEAMEFVKHDVVNAGLVFFALTLLSTLVLGRWFCGWACHLVALQDLCLGLLKKLGIRPRPLRSRALALVPLGAALYMFAWPAAYRLWSGAAFGPVEVELTETDFWGTFPPLPVALFTFAVCGFVTVYLLGAKGFCTYACPYGALFGVADRFAVGRIRVTDACEGCAHCTATCTSNVLVHEEVRTHGMVVDPGCMKCLDCVSVCPKGALYFGFGPPAVGRPAARRAKAGFGRGEELALAALFLGAFFVFRGIYGVVPFLLALALGGIFAACCVACVRLLRRGEFSFASVTLKRAGRLTAGGRVFVALVASAVLLAAHSAFVQLEDGKSSRAYAALLPLRGRLLDDPAHVPAPEERALAETGLTASGRVERFGLLDSAENSLRRGWFHLLEGDGASFVRELERAAGERERMAPELYGVLGRYYAARGRPDEAMAVLERALAERPEPGDADRLARLYWQAGQPERALAVFYRALTVHPDHPDLLFNLGVAQASQGAFEEAAASFRRVLALQPGRREAAENLEGVLRAQAAGAGAEPGH